LGTIENIVLIVIRTKGIGNKPILLRK